MFYLNTHSHILFPVIRKEGNVLFKYTLTYFISGYKEGRKCFI